MMSSRLADAPLKEILQRSNYTIKSTDRNQFKSERQLFMRRCDNVTGPIETERASRSISSAGTTFGRGIQFLNGLFTVTRKSQSPRQTTCAEFDCLFPGTRGKAEGAGSAPKSKP